MTPKEIKDEISRLQDLLLVIQTQCSHPEPCVTKQHDADTGNFCVSDDRYWTNFHCSLCGKSWKEDGSL